MADVGQLDREVAEGGDGRLGRRWGRAVACLGAEPGRPGLGAEPGAACLEAGLLELPLEPQPPSFAAFVQVPEVV